MGNHDLNDKNAEGSLLKPFASVMSIIYFQQFSKYIILRLIQYMDNHG